MGIQGLLPQLKSIMSPIHIEELRGQTVAVDTYSWLHKGALACSAQLCKGLPTTKHIDYCMHRVNLLRHHGVKPILVFDGGLLPMKMDQETKRSRARKENLERAVEHEESGNSAAAFECYQKAVDISPSIALELIEVLKKEKIDYIVAPYEADAQMTFLSLNKHVDAVITEDSDLVPFGCSRIIFKMDKFGQGVEFQSSKLGRNKELDFTGFTKQMLLEMCIFSGCDYLPSLPGMGLKRAYALVQKLKSYEKVIKHLRYSAISVPSIYEENFKKAIWAFKHQRVYDPAKEDITHLSDIPLTLDQDLEFLGPWLPQSVAKAIAMGDLDPLTKMPFQAKETCTMMTLEKAYSVKEFMPANGRKKLDLPVQKNLLTNYFCLASLEAKRKFRAPKAMPKHSEMTDLSSPSSVIHDSESPSSAEEAATCMIDQPQVSLLDSETLKNEQPSRKVIVRSKFFPHKLSNENDQENQNKEPAVNKGVIGVLGNRYQNNAMKKRKLIHVHAKDMGDVLEGSAPEAGSLTANLKKKDAGMKTEGTIGCDISHLNDYSGLAEKSMEKFASLISSFRYTSAGSRASGLRAPLKEVQNTCTERSTIKPIDFAKYRYIPNKKTS